ncbi:MAG TPA: tyrosine-type recombinase/integrase [Acidobacteriota bacterium]|nr:tyrosine-type recombinase/integrase [Acidobacteriota bacterium]
MPKLPRGMYKRGPCYYARIFEGGRERRKSLGREFGRAVTLLHRLRAGIASPAPHATVATLGRRWLETDVRTRKTERGRREAESCFRRFTEPLLGHLRVTEIRPDHLRELRIWIEGIGAGRDHRPFKPETVRHYLKEVRRFLNWLVDAGYLDRSPFPRGLMPRVPERPPDRLTEDEVRRLLTVAEPYRFTLRLGLATGLRWGELTNVQAKDVERGTLVVVAGKTGRVRRIPLPPDLDRAIAGRIGRLVPFSASSKGSFTRIVRRETGVARFHPHMLRHTAACWWLEAGVTLPAVQELLGHASVVTTQRYSRLSDAAVRRELERVWSETGTVTGSVGLTSDRESRGNLHALRQMGP